MDYRLDLYNAVSNYHEQMESDDVLFVVAYNNKNKDLMTVFNGNSFLLSKALSPNCSEVPSEHKEKYEFTQRAILNIAASIILTNKELKIEFDEKIKLYINKKSHGND